MVECISLLFLLGLGRGVSLGVPCISVASATGGVMSSLSFFDFGERC